MKKLLILVILLTACSSHIPPTRTEKPKQDLARIVAKELSNKPVVVIHDAPIKEIPDSDTVVYLCEKYDVGPYTDSALDATVRALNQNRAEIEDCANKQLKRLAAKYNLEIK